MRETCACGATYDGDTLSAIGFRAAHAGCRDAWATRTLVDAGPTCDRCGYVGMLTPSDGTILCPVCDLGMVE